MGVQIDFQQTFNSQIALIENKISRSIGTIIKIKSFLPPIALLKLYYASVHPHLLCGLPVWGITCPSYSAKLYTLQNKVVRHISGGSYRGDSTPFHSNLKILKLETAKLVFRHQQNNLTPLIFSLFIKTNDISVRHTRSSNPFNSFNLYIPKHHSARFRLQRCIRYQGVKIWNDIPSDIKNKIFNLLKRNYKKCLLNQYYDTTNIAQLLLDLNLIRMT